MAALAALMISPIPYPVFPRTGWRSKRALAGTVLLVTSFTLFVTNRLEFFFPLCLLYVAWGPLRWLISGLFERRQPTIPYDLSEGDDDEDEEEEFEPVVSSGHSSRLSMRDTRPLREEPPKRSRLSEDVKPARTDERPSRAERPDRPQRTEAEVAARKEKREKRDKREPRPERAPRPPRPDASTVVVAAVPLIVDEPAGAVAASADPIDSAGAGPEIGVTSPAPGTPEGAAPRKRKRRRRRGERKERGPIDPNAPSSAGAEGESGDFDGDDGGDFGDAERATPSTPTPASGSSDSPYSSTPAAPQAVPVIATVAPAAPPYAPHVEPSAPPTSSPDQHE